MSSTASSVLRADKVWMDGRLVKWDEANVHVMTHALHYGLGVFEGIRAYETKDGRLAIFGCASTFGGCSTRRTSSC